MFELQELMAVFHIHVPGCMLMHCPCLALENVFFPIVSSGDSTVVSQIIISCLPWKPTTAASLWILFSRKFSCQVASAILGGFTGSFWTRELFIHLPVYQRGSRTVRSSHSLPAAALMIAKQVSRLLSHSKEMSEPTWVSVRFPKHSWKTKNQIYWRCTQTRTYYAKKHK